MLMLYSTYTYCNLISCALLDDVQAERMLSYQLQLHSRLTPQLQQTLSSAASGSGQTDTSALGVGVQLVSALAPVPAGSQQQQPPQQSSTAALDLAFLMLRGLLSVLCVRRSLAAALRVCRSCVCSVHCTLYSMLSRPR